MIDYNRSPDRTVEQGADAAWRAGRDVADLVREKQLAYGDSSGVQHKIWHALLQQYRVPGTGRPGKDEHDMYIIPVALADHLPRLTRVLDRICRIVGNPAQDRLGEDPWRDLAGDAICGIVMPRTGPAAPSTLGWDVAPKPDQAALAELEVSDDLCADGGATQLGGYNLRGVSVIENDGRPHPGSTRYWNEGPVHPDEGI